MNLILLEKHDYITATQVELKDRRYEHILKVHQAAIGDSLKVGQLNGKLGSGKVIKINDSSIQLEISLFQEPPAALPLTLILALPRPKMLKRILENISSLGVKELYLINSYRVDKSYWSTPILETATTEHHLKLGLEQSVDTKLPSIHLRKRFKPFVEDELPQLVEGKRALIAHPYTNNLCPPASMESSVLVIGPEGGFIPYEVEKLEEAGLDAFHLGQRILKVETAITSCISRIFPVI